MSTVSDRPTMNSGANGLPGFLAPGEHVDARHPEVVAFAKAHTGEVSDELEVAVRLYYAVRDGIR